jgi:beta-mannosidase
VPQQTIPLTTFTLCDAEPGSGVDDVKRRPETDWLPATVPGGVHEALLAAGRIAEPYFDRNEDGMRWVEERDWWFRATVPATSSSPGGRTLLVCQGLDTVADLWLGGQPLGHSENMFRPATFDITGRLEAASELLICFRPPLAGLTPPAAATNLLQRLGDALGALAPEEPAGDQGAGIWSSTLPLATLRRKATFSWGWDFGPRLPSIGPWRPVEVVQQSGAVLTGHHVRTERVDVGRRTADLTVRVEATQLQEEMRPVAEVELVAPSGKITSLTVPLASDAAAETLSGASTVRVEEAELWWTHDLGEQPRYQVKVRLRDGERVLDERHDLVGLRTIALDRSGDPEGGRHFRFVLNGIPIFARGAAWLPADMLVGSVNEARYRELLTTARDGQMTMLRIWGGGIYEHDTFYSLCDELGLLIWQDFAFACIDYPDDDPLLRTEVEHEAAHQVRRLRNHACLALWCGNNEVQMIHVMGYRDLSPGGWGSAFFDEMLPAVVATHDGGVPYWPGSPYGEPVDGEDAVVAINGVLDGDRHAWEVWHGMDFGAGGDGDFASVGESRLYRRYAADRGKFISEFGIHASPELSTLRRWLPDDQLKVHSPGFDHHNKDQPKNMHDPVLEIVTGLPGQHRTVRRLHHDQPGGGAQVRDRALSAPAAALQRHTGLAVQRCLARLQLVGGRLRRRTESWLPLRPASVRPSDRQLLPRCGRQPAALDLQQFGGGALLRRRSDAGPLFGGT